LALLFYFVIDGLDERGPILNALCLFDAIIERGYLKAMPFRLEFIERGGPLTKKHFRSIG
jgi:hypothetical protein